MASKIKRTESCSSNRAAADIKNVPGICEAVDAAHGAAADAAHSSAILVDGADAAAGDAEACRIEGVRLLPARGCQRGDAAAADQRLAVVVHC